MNYEQDENLEKAIGLTYWGGDPNKASRAQAEPHYLKYVEGSTDNAQKARVFTVLGCLYSSAARPAHGEVANTAKAAEYFRQAIEADPQGISRTLITARHHLACFPKDHRERLKAHLDFIEYLSGLSAADIEKRVRPVTPDGDRQTAILIAERAVTEVMVATEDNTMALAGGTPTPEVEKGDISSDLMLQEIIRRFPNRPIADRARAKLKEMTDVRTSSILDVSALGNIECTEKTVARVPASAEVGGTHVTDGVALATSDTNSFPRVWAIVISVAAAIFLIGMAIVVRKRRSWAKR